MNTRTRHGIYLNLKDSSYRVKVGNFTYVFSSDLYMLKFLDTYMAHRDELSFKLSTRYHFKIRVTTWADVILYEKIEKRGFLIYTKDGIELCKERIVLNGDMMKLQD